MRKALFALMLSLVLGVCFGGFAAVAGEETAPLPGEVPPPPPPPPPPMDDTIPTDPPPPPPGDDDAGTVTTVTGPIDGGNGLPGEVAGKYTIGKVNATRVNVRSGPSTRFEIVTTLNRGAVLKVVAQSDDWLKIAYPEGEYCYIHPRHLQGTVLTDIPDNGLVRAVESLTAPIRVRNWEGSSAVGEVKQGDLVTIIGMRGQWAKVAPPATACAWIFKKYVVYEQEGVTQTDVPASSGLPEAGNAGTGAEKPVPQVSEETRKALEKRFEYLRKREEEYQQKRKTELDGVMDEIERELADIDADVARKKAEIARPITLIPEKRIEAPKGFTGWVEYIGHAGRRPAIFRLVKGGSTLFLLRSSKHDLAQYVNKMVLIDGNVELAPGFEANVMIVENIMALADDPMPGRTVKKIRKGDIPPIPKVVLRPAKPETEAAADEEDGVPIEDAEDMGTVDEEAAEEVEAIEADATEKLEEIATEPVVVEETAEGKKIPAVEPVPVIEEEVKTEVGKTGEKIEEELEEEAEEIIEEEAPAVDLENLPE